MYLKLSIKMAFRPLKIKIKSPHMNDSSFMFTVEGENTSFFLGSDGITNRIGEINGCTLPANRCSHTVNKYRRRIYKDSAFISALRRMGLDRE